MEPEIYERSNLTENQLLIWLGHKLYQEDPVYIAAVTFTFYGKIDKVHFQKAFQTLVNSSDSLRTVIEERDGVPQQKVLEVFPYEMEYADLSRVPDPQDSYQNWLGARTTGLFDLRKQLFDSALLRIAEEQYVWVLRIHHIVTDGWSMGLLYHYMSEFYGLSMNHCLDDIVALPQFADYIRREREERHTAHHLQALSYWKTKLDQGTEPLNFYGDTRLRKTTKARIIPWNLGVDRLKKLKLIASRPDVRGGTQPSSIFHVFAAVLFAYLYRISGNRFLSIGVPFHNRGFGDFKNTMGLIMEVLPLRIRIDQDDSFLSVIGKVRDELSENRAFREVALPNRPGDKYYDVLLNYHTNAFPAFHGVPVRHEWIRVGPEDDAFAMRIHDPDGSGNLDLNFYFHPDVFSEEQSNRAIEHFLRLLNGCLEDPAGSLMKVNLLSQIERQRILVEWNNTKRDYPDQQCVHELFEAQVDRSPDPVAVVFEEKQITYRELDCRANQMAAYLQKLGVGPDTLVAICIERSLEMVVALLGILKAGGAYVPLDPSYPQQRLAFMIKDANPAVLLTQGELLKTLPGDLPHAVNLDSEWNTIRQESVDRIGRSTEPENLAYVIYTSGTTGGPKGVMVCHRSVCNYLFWRSEYFPLTKEDRLLQTASFSFDDSVWEIFEPLMMGSQLIMAPADQVQDTTSLAQLIYEKQITALCLVPSMLEVFLNQPEIEKTCSSLRRVTTGGEALSVNLQGRFFSRFDVDLYNGYGPTETTMSAAFWKCKRSDNQAVVPIGRPIANVQLYILDSYLQPVPIGVTGEIYIGGIGLARGYWNRPELTAEKFIPDPFSNEPEARLYKSGDQARYLPDGNIEFIGRLDNQVKIRGFRVELGEIEAVLSQHPSVRDVVVLFQENGSGDSLDKRRTHLGGRSLVAYVAQPQQQSLSASELRGFLKQKVPDYMVPATFVFLHALPRTAHGKVDRDALPSHRQMGTESEETFVAARNTIEKTLAEIWTEVLGVERVGIYDNFFDLGGHSILAMQIISRIQKTFELELPLRSVFDWPTIAGLRNVIENLRPLCDHY